MAFKINGLTIKSKDDYLSKGVRDRFETTMRKDLKDDIVDLMKHLNRPLSVAVDVFVEMLLEDEELVNDFVSRVRSY